MVLIRLDRFAGVLTYFSRLDTLQNRLDIVLTRLDTCSDDIDVKRRLVAEDGPSCASGESLSRRGLHPTVTCSAILDDCSRATLSIPGRLFGGLFAYDIMHTVFIGAIGYLLEAVVEILTPTKRSELDSRSNKLSPLRNPVTGKCVRRILKVTRLAYLTAEQKVIALFTMSHAIGHRAEICPDETRNDVLSAISAMQIICSVTRGKKPFTEAEHNHVFTIIGKQFWYCLSRLVVWKETRRAKYVHKRNANRSPSKRKRVKTFKARPADPDESSCTVESDPEDSRVSPHFIRSDKIIPHSFVHLPEQVKLGGTYQFHNTSAVESEHTESIQLAGSRVRKYNAPNLTETQMLHYTLDLQLFDEIADIVHEGSS